MGRVSEEVCYQLSQGKFPPVPARGTEVKDPTEYSSTVHEAMHEFRSELEKCADITVLGNITD